MNQNKLYITLIFLTVVLACQPQRKLYSLYKMDQFNIESANQFVTQIQHLSPVYEISIVDTKADGNDFVVNRQTIFLDTLQQNQVNYYNYKKRAAELRVPADSLLNCLKTFYKIGVNEFCPDSNYCRFRVIVGLNVNGGYIYSTNTHFKPGDTLPATSTINKDYHFKVLLVKQVAKYWFEYRETE